MTSTTALANYDANFSTTVLYFIYQAIKKKLVLALPQLVTVIPNGTVSVKQGKAEHGHTLKY